MLAVPISLTLNALFEASRLWCFIILILFVALAATICVQAERLLGERDARPIVLDEIAGFLLANLGSESDPRTLLSAFLLFRLFDILKPYPARQLERRPGGVILDDLMAGLYAFLTLRLLAFGGVV